MYENVRMRVLEIIFILFVSFALNESVLEKAFNEGDFVDTEYVTVDFVESASHHGRVKRAAGDCTSPIMMFNLTVQGDPITLELTENTNVDFSKPIYTDDGDDTKVQTIAQLTDIKCYQDLAHYAAISVSGRPLVEGGCEYSLEGILGTDEGSFVIMPSQRASFDQPLIHAVKKVNESIDFSGDFAENDDESDPDDGTGGRPYKTTPKFPFTSFPGNSPKFRHRRAATNYKVEVFMVIDSLVYDFWYNRADDTNPTIKHNEAIAEIQRYYVAILNGIDLRYKSIIDPNVAFVVTYAGMYISTNSVTSPWTTGISVINPETPERPFVDPDVALPAFRTWRQSSFTNFSSDHSMLFSKAEFRRGNSSSIAGLAYVGGACGVSSCSVNEDLFNFLTITIAAHELGHNLGLQHDGTGNSCSAGDKFIMAPSVGPSTGATAGNHWLFSSCSIDYIQTFAESASGSCLLTDDSSENQTEFQNLQTLLPGEYYTLDDQCRRSFLNDSSYFCRGFYNSESYNEICPGAYCSIPGTSLCSKIIPGRGTPCGNQEWCIDSVCVPDSNAPVVVDSCPHGDQPSGFDSVGITNCSQVLTEAFRCYTSGIESRCCGTCAGLHTGTSGCEYGNRVSNCDILTQRRHCYIEPNENLCCGFCFPLKESYKIGCEYGDRIGSCVAGDCSSYTPTQLIDCCDTCMAYSTTAVTTTASETTAVTTTASETTAVTTTVQEATTVTSSVIGTTAVTTPVIGTTAATTPVIGTTAATTPVIGTTAITTPVTETTAVTTTVLEATAVTTTVSEATAVTTPGTETTTAGQKLKKPNKNKRIIVISQKRKETKSDCFQYFSRIEQIRI